MKTEIQAIETRWKGYRFRSRTEARWAVFFEEYGIPWEYEPQTFKLSNGQCYLPDFKLRIDGEEVWAEVKHEGATALDFSTARLFAENLSATCLLLDGPPRGGREYVVLADLRFEDTTSSVASMAAYYLSNFHADTGEGGFRLEPGAIRSVLFFRHERDTPNRMVWWNAEHESALSIDTEGKLVRGASWIGPEGACRAAAKASAERFGAFDHSGEA